MTAKHPNITITRDHQGNMASLLACCLVALVTVLLLSCRNETTPPTSLIPSDAMVVARLRLPLALADDADGPMVAEGIKHLLRQRQGMSRRVRRQVEKLIDSPERTGIDTQQPFYFFTTPSGERAMVGTVNDRSKLQSVLNSIARDEQLDSRVTTADGISLLAATDSLACLFTDDWFYIGHTDNADAMAAVLSRRADGADGCSLDAFDHAEGADAAVQLLITGVGLQAALDLGTIGEALPEGLDLSDVSLLLSLASQKGRATLTARLCTDNDQWQQFIGDADDMLKPIDKRQARLMSDRGLVVLAHLDARRLNDAAQSLAHAAHADDEGTLLTINNICKSFQGVLSADFYALDSCRMNFYMASSDTTLAHLVRELVLSDDSTTTISPHQYVFPLDTAALRSAHFGFSDGHTYLVTDSIPPFTLPASPLSPGNVSGRGLYVWMNSALLASVPSDSLSEAGRETLHLLGTTCRHIEASYQGAGVTVLHFVTADTSHSALALWLDALTR